MKKFRFSLLTLIILISSIYHFISCDVDHGLSVDDLSEKIKHGIKGTIIFNGTWPEDIVESRLVASVSFPPNPADTLSFSDPIPLGVDRFDYEFSLKPEKTYRLIAAVFREKEKSWEISNVLAVYSQKPDVFGLLFPDSVVVESDTSIVEGVDLFIDLNKGSISGTVTFTGDWPADTLIAGMAVFEEQSPPSFLSVKGLTLLPANVSNASYKVRVPPGSYEGITVLVIVNLDPINGRIIGMYKAPDDTTKPAVVVLTGQDTPGIDIIANLDLINQNN